MLWLQFRFSDIRYSGALVESYSRVTMGKYLMEAIFQKILDHDFSDLAGLTANASIPVAEALLNEVIANQLQGDKTIRSCQISIHEQNQVSVRLKTSPLPWALDLKLKLDTSVDFASFSRQRYGRDGKQSYAGKPGASLHALPEWLKLYGNQRLLILASFCAHRNRKNFLSWSNLLRSELSLTK
jgi:hypothetical protein